MSRARPEWIDAAVVGSVIAVGGFLRAWPIVEWPLWLDEGYTWRGSQAGWLDFLLWRHHYEQPPLGFALTHLSWSIFGTQAEWALRLPSTIASILCIPLAYLVGRVSASRLVGFLFAVLIAFDPVFVAQGRQARMYSLVVLFALAALLCLAALARRSVVSPTRGDQALVAGVLLCAGVACWTHSLGLVLGVAVIVGLAVMDRHRVALVGSVLLAAAAIPMVWRAFSVSTKPQTYTPDLVWGTTLNVFWAVANLYHATSLGPVLIAGAAVAGLMLLARRSRPTAMAAVVMLGLGLLISIPAAMERSFGIDRYLVVSRVGFHLGIAALAGLLPSARARWAVAAVLLVLAGRLMLESARFEMPVENRAGQVARVMAPMVGPGEVVYYRPYALMLVGQYYGVPEPQRVWQTGFFPEPYPYTASWFVTGHAAPGSSIPIRLIERLSTHHGAYFDPLLYNQLYSEHRALATRVAPGDVAFLTPQGMWARSSVRLTEPAPD